MKFQSIYTEANISHVNHRLHIICSNNVACIPSPIVCLGLSSTPTHEYRWENDHFYSINVWFLCLSGYMYMITSSPIAVPASTTRSVYTASVQANLWLASCAELIQDYHSPHEQWFLIDSIFCQLESANCSMNRIICRKGLICVLRRLFSFVCVTTCRT